MGEKDNRIVLLGLMGSGKTTVGESLARHLGWSYRDNDHELLARFGASAAVLSETTGLSALHAAEAAVLLDLLGEGGRSVITAAASTAESPACRRALVDNAFVVWLHAEPETLAARATIGAGRPWEGDIEAQLRAQAARRHPLFEQVADLTVSTTDLDGERIAAQIAAAFSRRSAATAVAVTDC